MISSLSEFLLSRLILHTWRITWCIWSGRIRIRCTTWICCGGTTRGTAASGRQPMCWPVSLTCTGLEATRHEVLSCRQTRLAHRQYVLTVFFSADCVMWSHSTEISLKQRLEYIARAILSAKSSSSISAQASDGEFLHELEEKMDVRTVGRNRVLILLLKLNIVFCSFPAGAHPSTDSGDPDQTVQSSSCCEKCNLSVGLWTHGHHQGNPNRKAKVYLLKYFTEANILLLPYHIYSVVSIVSS